MLRMLFRKVKFCLESDICPIAAGSALDQQQYDEWLPIGYHSDWLLKVVENCGTTELELCGLVVKMYSLRQLFCNVHFKFWLMKKLLKILRKAKCKLARLLGHLSALSFEVKFKPRKRYVGQWYPFSVANYEIIKNIKCNSSQFLTTWASLWKYLGPVFSDDQASAHTCKDFSLDTSKTPNRYKRVSNQINVAGQNIEKTVAKVQVVKDNKNLKR